MCLCRFQLSAVAGSHLQLKQVLIIGEHNTNHKELKTYLGFWIKKGGLNDGQGISNDGNPWAVRIIRGYEESAFNSFFCIKSLIKWSICKCHF